jgi:exosortase H (IPTLxxWG-CTERM-specific)
MGSSRSSRKAVDKAELKKRDEGRRFLVKFVVLLAILYGIVAANPVNDAIVVPFTAWIANGTAVALAPFSDHVVAEGTLVTDGTTAVNIENGCNALEACIILVAAIVAFPAPVRSKLLAVLAGCVALQVINLVRTSSLFLLLKHQPRFFETAHGGVWQVVLVLLAVGFFLLWSMKQNEAVPSE